MFAACTACHRLAYMHISFFCILDFWQLNQDTSTFNTIGSDLFSNNYVVEFKR